MQSIVDPVFGKLELGSIWTGEVRLPLFEKTFGLEIVNPDKEPPDDMQRDYWQVCMQRQQEMKTSVQSAPFDYYCAHLEEIRAGIGETAFPPSLAEPSQIWTVVALRNYLWLDRVGEIPLIMIQLDAEWDEEHGLELSFCKDLIGIGEGGTHWVNQDHYDLNGQRVFETPA